MGRAITDYLACGKARALVVRSPQFDDDEMSVEHLFRTPAQMPRLEQEALRMARGRVLDVGAGAGCHTLALQQRLPDVTALDISSLSVQAMRRRGVRRAVEGDFLTAALRPPYDTLLLLMNGTGIAGSLNRLPALLTRCRELLAEGGQVLTDSTDLSYLFDSEQERLEAGRGGRYYGEVRFQMAYGDTTGQPFDWLYVDFGSLSRAAASAGLVPELVARGDHYDYLARLIAGKR